MLISAAAIASLLLQVLARRFVEHLRTQYPRAVLPNFYEGSYSEALRAAETSATPLLVFLHSDLHQDAADFVEKAFCTAQVRQTAWLAAQAHTKRCACKTPCSNCSTGCAQ